MQLIRGSLPSGLMSYDYSLVEESQGQSSPTPVISRGPPDVPQGPLSKKFKLFHNKISTPYPVEEEEETLPIQSGCYTVSDQMYKVPEEGDGQTSSQMLSTTFEGLSQGTNCPDPMTQSPLLHHGDFFNRVQDNLFLSPSSTTTVIGIIQDFAPSFPAQ